MKKARSKAADAVAPKQGGLRDSLPPNSPASVPAPPSPPEPGKNGLDQVRAWALLLARSEEKERHRMALVIRDDLQQILYGANLCAEVLRSRIREKETLKILGQISEYIKKGIETGRGLSLELSPPIVYDAGLGHALFWLGLWLEDKFGLKVDVHTDPQAEPLNEEVRVQVFRAARELLLSLAADPSKKPLRLCLSCSAGSQLLLAISRKRNAGEKPPASGSLSSDLQRIQARMALVNGSLAIEPGRAGKTEFRLFAPLAKDF